MGDEQSMGPLKSAMLVALFASFLVLVAAQPGPPQSGPCVSKVCEAGTKCVGRVNFMSGQLEGRCVLSKPGACPAVRDSRFLFLFACSDRCRDDGGCPGDLKCCPSSTCQGSSCQAPAAPPQPVSKAGRCPQLPVFKRGGRCVGHSRCEADAECEGRRKCCRNLCGETSCLTPQADEDPAPSCQTTVCGDSERCVMQQSGCTLGQPCPLKPVCVADGCPRVVSGVIGCFPLDLCSPSLPCPGRHICCPTSCGRRCLRN